jgi:hypothetical protein
MMPDTLPAFVFAATAIEALDANPKALADYDPRYVVAPFERFVVRARPNARVRFSGTAGTVPFAEIIVEQVEPGVLRATEMLAYTPRGVAAGEVTIRLDERMARWTRGVAGSRTEVPSSQSWWPLSADRDATSTARIVVGCLLALNHRDVRISETQPTRQQRRAAERDGKPVEVEHVVVVGREIVQRAGDVARGRNAVRRAAHLVRSHVRHLQDGRLTTVRAHQRGIGRLGTVTYDATRVGGAV